MSDPFYFKVFQRCIRNPRPIEPVVTSITFIFGLNNTLELLAVPHSSASELVLFHFSLHAARPLYFGVKKAAYAACSIVIFVWIVLVLTHVVIRMLFVIIIHLQLLRLFGYSTFRALTPACPACKSLLCSLRIERHSLCLKRCLLLVLSPIASIALWPHRKGMVRCHAQ